MLSLSHAVLTTTNVNTDTQLRGIIHAYGAFRIFETKLNFGTIPYDIPDDAERRGWHLKSSEPESPAADPVSHTPVRLLY